MRVITSLKKVIKQMIMVYSAMTVPLLSYRYLRLKIKVSLLSGKLRRLRIKEESRVRLFSINEDWI